MHNLHGFDFREPRRFKMFLKTAWSRARTGGWGPVMSGQFSSVDKYFASNTRRFLRSATEIRRIFRPRMQRTVL